MAFSLRRKRQTLQGRYTPRLWPVWVVAPLALFATAALGWTIYTYAYDYFAQAAAEHKPPEPVNINDVLKATVTALTLIGAVLAGLYAYRKQLLAEGESHRADARQFADRYTAATEQLGHDQAAVRLAGIYALVRLADDWNEQRQVCIDVLCAYLRMPYEPDPAASGYKQGDREVRQTIIGIIRDHLMHPDSPTAWCRYRLDFTGAVFDGADFSSSHFQSNVSFNQARFVDGRVSFRRARFDGGLVDFRGARFSGGTVDFDRIALRGGTVDFRHARFEGGTADFERAQFSGGRADFRGTTFSGGTITFVGATFSRGEVSFGRATFEGSAVSFDHAIFSGGRASFGDARFDDGAVTFDHAIFSGGRTTFGHARFDGSRVTFSGARFDGGNVTFIDARFISGVISFSRAGFNGSTVTFDRARFSGSRVGFDRARFSGGTVTFERTRFNGIAIDWGPLPVPVGA